jgi:hypothetical protein
MATHSKQKLKHLLEIHKPDTILLAQYLSAQGISHDLQQYYIRSGWLTRTGNGAFKRPGDVLDWQGVLYSLQAQIDFPVHVGALSALAMQGYSHYVRQEEAPITLFSDRKRRLPMWVLEQPCCRVLSFHCTAFMKNDDTGLVRIPFKSYELTISNPERAILEALYLTPVRTDFSEVFQVMESLTTLRPAILQSLIAACGSIRVKRLFLLMATKANHGWIRHLDKRKIDLGSGPRMFSNGVYMPEFKISVPKELVSLWGQTE